MKKRLVWIGAAIVAALAAVAVALGLLYRLPAGGSSGSHGGEEEIHHVSMIQLIANPDAYHGKRVSVTGVGYVAHENDCLALTREDLTHFTKNCIPLDLESAYADTLYEGGLSYYEARQYNGQYVRVVGVFEKVEKYYGRFYNGRLRDITVYEPLRSDTPDYMTADPVTLPAPYGDVVRDLIAAYPWESDEPAVVPGRPEMSRMYTHYPDMEAVGCALLDIDGDGQEELLLAALDTRMLFDVYTLKDGQAVHLLTSGEKSFYTLCDDGTLEHSWKESAACSGHDFYRLQDGALVLQERIALDPLYALETGRAANEEDNEDTFFYTSATPNREDYVPLTDDEALERIDKYQSEAQEWPPYAALADYR